MTVELNDFGTYFGFGVAGNFAGHLEQAGEAADFVGVGDLEVAAPKGVFPFYVPGSPTFLGVDPLSHDRLAKPAASEPVNMQIEPEVGLVCEVIYAQSSVAQLNPIAVGAFNDCSIRRPGAKKISEKKNWGRDSKGVARTMIEVTDIDPTGPTQSLRIASFLCRDGETSAYGIDSPVVGYSYYGRQLLDWLVDRLNNQPGADDSPLEPVGEYLLAAGSPSRVLIGVGATRYTALGESTYLDVGDESIVVLYDGNAFSEQVVADAIAAGSDHELNGASVLRQAVYAS